MHANCLNYLNANINSNSAIHKIFRQNSAKKMKKFKEKKSLKEGNLKL